VTPPTFIVGVKLNSADHQSPTGLQEGLEQIELINSEKIDFLEISGGTYEDPKVRRTLMSTAYQPKTVSDAPKRSLHTGEEGLNPST